ncbi:MAG: type II toxin-antitoxin system HicB family antitoxin [Lachnospiraceae bacterium]|nr:type II toxin-antitoxin system HicB family antitoxin [Lachnospiraceae bacterium]
MRLKDYLRMPYTRLIREINDESGHYYFGRVLELDGCQSSADSIEELNRNLSEVMKTHIGILIKNNLPVPLPENADDYSGRFVLRLPKTLHQRLSIEARREGVSLNQWAVYKLAR